MHIAVQIYSCSILQYLIYFSCMGIDGYSLLCNVIPPDVIVTQTLARTEHSNDSVVQDPWPAPPSVPQKLPNSTQRPSWHRPTPRPEPTLPALGAARGPARWGGCQMRVPFGVLSLPPTGGPPNHPAPQEAAAIWQACR